MHLKCRCFCNLSLERKNAESLILNRKRDICVKVHFEGKEGNIKNAYCKS